jgi:hypothetical protein
MSLEEEIFEKTGEHLAGNLSLLDLFAWVWDNESYFSEQLPVGNEARELSSAIQLAVFEIQSGHSNETSASEQIAAEFAVLTASGSRP